MTEDFILIANDSPIELDQPGITLIAPGLHGTGIYIGKTDIGKTREFNIEQLGLNDAVSEANLEDRHTLIIDADSLIQVRNQGDRTLLQDVAEDEVLLQVPGNLDEFQFVIYTDEAGVISLHYPLKINTNKALPSRAFGSPIQNQYRIPLRTDQYQNQSKKASRGLFGKIGSKVLKVLVGKIFLLNKPVTQCIGQLKTGRIKTELSKVYTEVIILLS